MDNINKLVSENVINELFEIVSIEPMIMANNWLGYAYFAICKEICLLSGCKCKEIDHYLSLNDTSEIVAKHMMSLSKWRILYNLHELHHERSYDVQYEEEYLLYNSIVDIKLPHYLLSAE